MARRFALVVAVLTTVLVALAAPSWAHHKAGHSGGAPSGTGGGGGSGSGYTEDNDTNDNNTPNNIPDSGDNAHPSGKDKSVEHGNSGNQGNSGSDPDDDGRGPDRSNGGADKPNGPGGVDLADQDGNNGCGNDDDFEDDNEGWCGKPKDKVRSDEDTEVAGKDVEKDRCVKGDEMNGDVECGPKIEVDVEAEASVIGTVIGNVDLPFDLDGSDDAQVLGESIERGNGSDDVAAEDFGQPLPRSVTEAEDSGALPFTGADILAFLVVGLGLVIGGLILKSLRVPQ